MDYIYLGKIVNTHGIKGEIRIMSDFEKKNLVFVPGFKVYIGASKKEEVINTYRHHKNYDMITLKGIDDINEVLKYKGESIYINKSDLSLDDYLMSDLIGLEVIDDNTVLGVVSDYDDFNGNVLLKVEGNKSFYLPYNHEYISKVDITAKRIIVKNCKGLML